MDNGYLKRTNNQLKEDDDALWQIDVTIEGKRPVDGTLDT